MLRNYGKYNYSLAIKCLFGSGTRTTKCVMTSYSFFLINKWYCFDRNIAGKSLLFDKETEQLDKILFSCMLS